VDTLKSGRSRTVPLAELVPVVDEWAADKSPDAWIFAAPEGGPLRESNWKRSVGWTRATTEVGVRPLRVHDLRHTAASIWLAQGADPKVVQRVLGHATASMTMDLYGHLLDANLWDAARRIGASQGHFPPSSPRTTRPQVSDHGPGLGLRVEPPVGIEPTTYALRVRRSGRLS
jgi:hypothetical protein